MLRAIRDAEHAQRINETTERARRKATLLQKRGKQHFSNQNDDEKKQLQSWICLFHHEGWDVNRYVDEFIQVVPIEYKRVLQEEQMRKLQQKIADVQRDY